MNAPDHNKMIAAAAKSTLIPLGCIQKGRSRTWIDDNDWWVTVIEFQPSSWAKGSSLNVGVCWLWHENDYYSFDYGDRIQPFAIFENHEQFSIDVQRLADSAKDAVIKFRNAFAEIQQTSINIINQQTTNPWSNFHAAIASMLADNKQNAEVQFKVIQNYQPESAWDIKLKKRASELQSLMGDSNIFKSEIIASIIRTRMLLNLPPLACADPFVP